MPARYMRGNQGTETPSTCLFFDTESVITQHPTRKNRKVNSLRLWCGTHVRYEKGEVKSSVEAHGFTSESFWTWVRSCYTTGKALWMFAHNAAFDLTLLDWWNELDTGRFTLKPLYRHDKEGNRTETVAWYGKLCLEIMPFFAQFREELNTIKVVDTLNYWPKALRKIGKFIGLEKGELPADDAPQEVWLAYCRTDVDIIKHAVTDLFQRWRAEDCGVVQMTAPMMALTNFKHKCTIRTPDKRDVDIVCQPDHKSHSLERDCYIGGRFHCYYVGVVEEKVYHIDCNSLYPYVMREHSFPRRLVRYQENPSYDDVSNARAAYGIAAECLIESRDTTYPVRIGGKQHHCTGKYWAALCGPELSRAIDNKHILRFGTVQYYSIAPLFRDWLNYWLSRKLEAAAKGEGGLGELEYVKLIINSLSGKFAQRGRCWKDIHGRIPLVKWGGWPEKNGENGEYEQWRSIGGNCQKLCDDGEPGHSFPIISAFITAHARTYMESIINLAGEENVYYLATDAIICNATAFRQLAGNDLIHPTEIGKFKVVTAGRSAEIVGANFYSIDGVITSSGILGKCIKAARDGKQPERWEQVTSLIAQGPRSTVDIESVEEPTIDPDHRGVIGEDGRWKPYRLSFDGEFTDSPRRSRWQFVNHSEKEQDQMICRTDS